MTDKVNWLNGFHGIQPTLTRLRRDGLKPSDRLALLCEVSDQAAVSDHQSISFEPRFDACQQSAHGRAITVANIAKPGRVDFLLPGEQVHSAAQIDHQLDLILTVLRRKGDPGPTGPYRRCTDGQDNSPCPGEILGQGQESSPVSRKSRASAGSQRTVLPLPAQRDRLALLQF